MEPQVSWAFFREILPVGYRKLNQRVSNSLIGCILYCMGKRKLRHRSKAIFLKNYGMVCLRKCLKRGDLNRGFAVYVRRLLKVELPCKKKMIPLKSIF